MPYYKTTIVFEVLTDEPLPDELTITDIIGETMHGHASGDVKAFDTVEVSRDVSAQLLIVQRSDPAFLIEDYETGGA